MRHSHRFPVILAPVALLISGCGIDMGTPPQTVESVELARYAGVWHEIAKYPTSFQQDCTGTTAEYTLRDDGRVGVFNRCFEGSLDGPEDTIEGTARVVEDTGNAQLKVSFFPFIEGDYWILDLGEEEDYGYAVVASPNRQFLWFLSRTPQMDPDLYAQLEAFVVDQGFDPTRLELTEQPESTDDGA
jgi:apolipoprotein D and lipocalin family protein